MGGFRRCSGAERGWTLNARLRAFAHFAARVCAYLIVAVAAFVVAFLLGSTHYERTQCNDPDIVDCDLGVAEGALWAYAATAVVLAAAIAIEARIWIRRRRMSS
jgi:putative copper export protein